MYGSHVCRVSAVSSSSRVPKLVGGQLGGQLHYSGIVG
jgi:hypothetical protein